MRRILVLRGGALGDFIVTLPALALLRQRWPGARIELAGNATATALAVARGVIDAAHSQHERRWSALFAAPNSPLQPEFATWLAQFDLVINYWPDPDGALRCRFPAHPAQMYLSAPAMPACAPAAAHYAAALRELDLEMTQPFFPLKPLEEPSGGSESSTDTRSFSETAKVPSAGGAIAVHPGSGSDRKNWPAENWLRLIPQLDAPVRVILGETEIDRWSARVPGSPRVQAMIMAPLEELVTTFASCRLFLGHDSGISHLAAACGVPCVLLFGPTDPAVWAPPAPKVRVLRAGSDLKRLSVEEVLETAKAVLADRR